MKYKIWDNQNGGWLAQGESFDSLEDVREHLISYHSADCDEESLKEQSLYDIVSGFEWTIEDEDGNPVDTSKLEEIK